MSENQEELWNQDARDEGLGIPVAAGYGDGKTGEQIADEAKFPTPKAGKNEYFCSGIQYVRVKDDEGNELPLEETVFDAFFPDGDGFLTVNESYAAYRVMFIFRSVTDPRVNLRDFHVLPPADENGAYFYAMGASKKKEGAKASGDPTRDAAIHWRKLRHLLHAMGHPDGPDGRLPATCSDLTSMRLWPDGSPRTVVLDVEKRLKKDDNYKLVLDKNGNPQPALTEKGFEQFDIKFFAYEMSEDTTARLARSGNAPPSVAAPRPAPPAANRPAPPQTRPTPPANRPSPPASRPAPPAAAPAAPAGAARPPRRF